MCGICLGGFFCDVAFDVGVMPIVGDWPLGGGRGLFLMKCGMCTIYCVRTNDNLLCARNVFVENVLAHAVIETLPDHRSAVEVTRESHKSVFSNK